MENTDASKPKPFPFVLEGYRKPSPFVVREQAMMLFVDRVTDKPRWHQKVFDDEIVANWRAEVAAMAEAAKEPFPWILKQQRDQQSQQRYQQHQQQQQPEGDNDNAPTVHRAMRKGFSDEMFDYCIAELRHKAAIFERVGFVEVLETFASVFKADALVPDELRQALIDAIRPLEDIPAKRKDWHPESDGKVSLPSSLALADGEVLDLVHPSLWPLVRGRTLIVDDEIALEDTIASIGSGKVSCAHDLQWLPAEVDLHDDGTTTFASYINNLHPRHKELYEVLGKLVSKLVPMWAATYKRAVDGQQTGDDEHRHWRIPYYGGSGYVCHMSTKCDDCSAFEGPPRGWQPDCDPVERHPSVEVDGAEVAGDMGEAAEGGGGEHDPIPADNSVGESPPPSDDSFESDDYNGYDFWDWAKEGRSRHTVIQPEPDNFKPETEESIAATFLQRGPWFEAHQMSKAARSSQERGTHRLQVIVKLANIHLTPEKPTYDGSGWHIEGVLNERICATGIYYYAEENITASHLRFRTGTDEHFQDVFRYKQADHREFDGTFPLDDGGDIIGHGDYGTVFNLGEVETRQGRLVTFPNVLQHRVQPFQLKDKTKPGHRKIVAFFLVDPATTVTSTAHVPPQQKHWSEHSVFGDKLPTEIDKMIMSFVPDAPDCCPYGRDEADGYRLDIMKQRDSASRAASDQIETGMFSLCTH